MRRREFLGFSLGVAALWPARGLLASQLADVPGRTLTGSTTTLRAADISDLAAGLRGQVLMAGHRDYDDARRVWNAMFDRRPTLIARCASPTDVLRAVNFAREHELLTAVRAGGHSLSGKSTCDGGMVIDLSPMQSVRVDPRARRARVEGGALLRHLDHETRPFGLVTTAGTVSHTGAAGLTLGGGFGRVGRRFGLACDNLHSVDVVTADGRLLTASAEEHADLLWGLRGGGGNFGVATSFEYRLHPMNPTVLGGVIAWPFSQAREVLRFYAELSERAPDELNTDLTAFHTPDGALLALEACWSADPAQGERVLEGLRRFGRPAFDRIGPTLYVDLQRSGDEVNAAGRRIYSKSAFLGALTPELIDTLVTTFEAAPRGQVLMLQQAGGAIGRTPVDATAFPNRGARYWLMMAAGWKEQSEDEQRIAGVREAWSHVEPQTEGFYVNAMSEEQYAGVATNYGANYPRLRVLKRKYDPGNFFRLNANVEPA